jgi:hypothetical protein
MKDITFPNTMQGKNDTTPQKCFDSEMRCQAYGIWLSTASGSAIS